MVEKDTIDKTKSNELTSDSKHSDNQTDNETDGSRKQPITATEGNHSKATAEAAATPQKEPTGSETGRELLNSEAAQRFKTQFRRKMDSKVVSTATVKDSYVLTLDSESTGEWMTRVPATRKAVNPGEKLWRIPDNWENRLTVTNTHKPDERLYSIPESGVFVIIELLAETPLERSGYRVTAVGDIEITYNHPNMDRLQTVMGKYNADVEALNKVDPLIERWDSFNQSYLARLMEEGRPHVMSALNIPMTPTVDSWYFHPWGDEQEQVISEIISKVCEVDDDVSELLADFLIYSVVVPHVKLTVDEDSRLPQGYWIQAAVERGSVPAEAVEEFTERLDDAAPMWSEAIQEGDDRRMWEIHRTAAQQLAAGKSE